MEYTYLGRSGIKVSKLCLGTMNFGVNTDEKEAFRIMDAALDAGVNFLIRPIFTDGAKTLGRQKKSLAAGLPKAEVAARKSCWPPRFMAI